jgi:hypothetical protein
MLLGMLALLAALLIGLRHAARNAEPVAVRVPVVARHTRYLRARR